MLACLVPSGDPNPTWDFTELAPVGTRGGA